MKRLLLDADADDESKVSVLTEEERTLDVWALLEVDEELFSDSKRMVVAELEVRESVS